MGFKDITEGTRKAKLIGARFIRSKGSETKKPTTGLECMFEFVEPVTGTVEKLPWVGWFSKDAMERSMETLTSVLEYNGNDDVNENGEITDRNAFNYDKEVDIVIEPQTYEGKTYMRISWLNNPLKSVYAPVGKDELKNSLGALGFKAAFLAAQQKKGQAAGAAFEAKKATVAAKPKGKKVSDEEVPF